MTVTQGSQRMMMECAEVRQCMRYTGSSNDDFTLFYSLHILVSNTDQYCTIALNPSCSSNYRINIV